jgi:hypothetical protein
MAVLEGYYYLGAERAFKATRFLFLDNCGLEGFSSFLRHLFGLKG